MHAHASVSASKLNIMPSVWSTSQNQVAWPPP